MSFIKPVLLQNGKLTLAPVGACVYEVRALLNGTSKNMTTVSTAPQTFIFSPVAGTTYYLAALSIAFASTGTPDPTDFGNIAALTNGIALDLKSQGVTNNITILKDNFDIALTFFQSTTVGGSAGFLNDADAYTGSLTFNSPIILSGISLDFIRAVVNNVTTGSGTDLRMYAHLYKELP